MAPFVLRGVVSATLTPFDSNNVPDAAKAIGYYRELLYGGCDGLNLLGTTGEGVSVSVRERLGFMERVAAALPLERLIVGTGATALGDAIELTRAAMDLGFAAALVIPPFYYRDAPPDGIAQFYAALTEKAGVSSGRLMLYNFPRMSGIAFTQDLVARIYRECGDAIGGVKDSSNDLQLGKALHENFPDLAIFPGSEEHLLTAREGGWAGCISGSVCLWPQLAREVWRDGDAEKARELTGLRAGLSGNFLIASVRERVADARKDAAWKRGALPL